MEGRDREARVAPAQARGETLTEVGGGLAREGEDEQLFRAGELLVDEADGSLDDDARLPGARPGENESRALAVRDGGLLMRVETSRNL